MAKHMKARPRPRKFTVIFGGLMLALMLTIGGLLCYLWMYLSAYETAQPHYALERYFDLIAGERYGEAMALVGLDRSPMVREQDFAAYVKEHYPSSLENLKFYKAGGGQGENLRFHVYQGEEKFAVLEVAPTGEKGKFGLTSYQMAPLTDVWIAPVTIKAPRGVAVRVNGAAVDASCLTGEENGRELYGQLPKGVDYPAISVYRVEGLLAQPTVEGEGCVPQWNPDKTTVCLKREVSQEQQEAFSAMAQKAARDYASYITKDASLAQVTAHLLPGTDFYKRVGKFDNVWYNSHEKMYFENAETDNLTLYDPDHFTIDLRMTQVVVKNGKDNVYDLSYSMAYVRKDGQWKLSQLISR